tara:strand:- start:58 stop:657 length:600 start_codon:yes stop_codon:yes gene_type:complete
LKHINNPPKIGVLALQGDFKEHINCLKQLDVSTLEIKKPDQLNDLDGLIIPGGESTTISRLIRIFKFEKNLKQNVSNGMAIWGTCAGMIIISKNLTELYPKPIGLLDITVSRNWFGRQIDSFEKDIKIKGLKKPFRAVFIRAPIVKTVGENIEILSTIENKYPVAVKTEKILATSFHPELTNDLRIHKIFLKMIKKDPY